MSISVIILNHLPVDSLSACLKSASFADEIVIVHDSNSLASPPVSKNKIKVYSRPLNQDFAAQRNFGLKKVTSDWLLFLDSDEIITPALKTEIIKTISSDTTNNFSGFYLKRDDSFYGQTLKHGETGQIRLLRLARKNAGKFSRQVHESWQIKGRVGELDHPLLHQKTDLANSFLERISLYGPIDAQSLVKENKPFSWFRLFCNPPAKFLHNYIVRLGIIDGLLGLFHAYLMSLQSLSIRIFQWQADHLSSKS